MTGMQVGSPSLAALVAVAEPLEQSRVIGGDGIDVAVLCSADTYTS